MKQNEEGGKEEKDVKGGRKDLSYCLHSSTGSPRIFTNFSSRCSAVSLSYNVRSSLVPGAVCGSVNT